MLAPVVVVDEVVEEALTEVAEEVAEVVVEVDLPLTPVVVELVSASSTRIKSASSTRSSETQSSWSPIGKLRRYLR